jgi:hypothetical protein
MRRTSSQRTSCYDLGLAPVSAHRAEDLARPVSFDELIPYIDAARARIADGSEKPVIIVNGDRDIERASVDFDQRPVWKILVGAPSSPEASPSRASPSATTAVPPHRRTP